MRIENGTETIRVPRRRYIRWDGPDLDAVANTYRLAVRAGEPAPTRAVAERLNVGYRTAARYVHMAREAGLLPPTRSGVVRA
jgi:hypothetical protein